MLFFQENRTSGKFYIEVFFFVYMAKNIIPEKEPLFQPKPRKKSPEESRTETKQPVSVKQARQQAPEKQLRPAQNPQLIKEEQSQPEPQVQFNVPLVQQQIQPQAQIQPNQLAQKKKKTWRKWVAGFAAAILIIGLVIGLGFYFFLG